MLQLNPQFHLYVPHLDDFLLAWLVIDYHTEEHLYWVGAMEKTGEIWTLANDQVRACKNPSVGRTLAKHPSATPSDWTIEQWARRREQTRDEANACKA